MTGTWPKLSETLKFRLPLRCNNCNLLPAERTVWSECDDRDRPTPVFVVLCKGCADRIIEPHPRLYRQLSLYEPAPGVMPICADCPDRDGLRCTSPVAKLNGGPGLKFEPEGQMVHLCRVGWSYISAGPITSCSGKAVGGEVGAGEIQNPKSKIQKPMP